MDGILIPYNDDCQNIIEMGGLKKANVKKDETKWYNTLAFIIMRNILDDGILVKFYLFYQLHNFQNMRRLKRFLNYKNANKKPQKTKKSENTCFKGIV